LFESLTWQQLAYHTKPIGLLNVNGFFDALIAFLDHARDERFLRDLHRESLQVDTNLEALINKLRASEAPDTGKWLDRAKRDDVV
jgi:predicted Rossmann-fold nucleotide-binding protein